jgi:hypothetical protein
MGVKSPKPLRNEGEEQLSLGVSVSAWSQFLIRVRRTLAEMRYSPLAILLGKIPLWINVGIVLYIIFRFWGFIFLQVDSPDIFLFPGLFSAGFTNLSIGNAQVMQYFILGIISVNVFFIFISYQISSLQRTKILDAVLLILFLINILFLKIMIQGVWIWSL